MQQLCPDTEEAGDIFVYRNLRMWRAHRVRRLGEHCVLDQRLDMGMLFQHASFEQFMKIPEEGAPAPLSPPPSPLRCL